MATAYLYLLLAASDLDSEFLPVNFSQGPDLSFETRPAERESCARDLH